MGPILTAPEPTRDWGFRIPYKTLRLTGLALTPIYMHKDIHIDTVCADPLDHYRVFSSFDELTELSVYITSTVTGHHRGPKRKAWAGYGAPSLQRTSYFSLLSIVSRAFCVLCIFSKFGHHPCPSLPLCQISFLWRPPLLRWPMEKTSIHTQSINHSPSLFDVPGTETFGMESLF